AAIRTGFSRQRNRCCQNLPPNVLRPGRLDPLSARLDPEDLRDIMDAYQVLRDIGVSLVGHRRKLLAAIPALCNDGSPKPIAGYQLGLIAIRFKGDHDV